MFQFLDLFSFIYQVKSFYTFSFSAHTYFLFHYCVDILKFLETGLTGYTKWSLVTSYTLDLWSWGDFPDHDIYLWVFINVKCIKTLLLFLLTGGLGEFQEIQKIVVFEGAFDKIFSIIKEEGGSEGGVVVQVIPSGLWNLLDQTTEHTCLWIMIKPNVPGEVLC